MRLSHPFALTLPTSRRPTAAAPGARCLCTTLAALTLACGDSAPSTALDTLPNVAGRYQRSDAVAPVTCTPQQPPPGGEVVLEAFSSTTQVRIAQTGARLSMSYPEFPGSQPDTGSIDRDGTATFGYRELFQEVATRQGNRVFFVDLTGSWTVRAADGGTRLSGTGAYVNIFREGAASAPVFGTCSRTSTVELVRLGD